MVISRVWPKFDLNQVLFMHALVTSKNEADPIKNEGSRVTTFLLSIPHEIFIVSVQRTWELRTGCTISLWPALNIPFNYFKIAHWFRKRDIPQ